MRIQQEEIKTIKPRTYNLKLSDADYQRLSEKAGSCNMTAEELLENFIGDLVYGTYTNGSDERMYANEWFDRCGFSYTADVDKTLIQYMCSGLSVTDIECFVANISEIESIKEDIQETEKQLANPEAEKWQDFITVSKNGEEPTYKTLDDFIKELEDDLQCEKEALSNAEAELEETKQCYLDYSKAEAKSWENELDAFKEWYINHYMIKD